VAIFIPATDEHGQTRTLLLFSALPCFFSLLFFFSSSFIIHHFLLRFLASTFSWAVFVLDFENLNFISLIGKPRHFAAGIRIALLRMPPAAKKGMKKGASEEISQPY
jgi:hypothetical protein